MLPDGYRFLYWSAGVVYLAAVGSTESRKVLDNPSSAIYASGHLIFVRDGSLMAQPFDAEAVRLTGAPVRLADRVLHRLLFRGMVSASKEVLVYRTGAAPDAPEIAMIERNGKLIDVLGRRTETNSVAFSPDGTRIAFDVVEPDASSNIWLYDIRRKVRTRLTFSSSFARTRVWSPDSLRIAFTASNQRGSDLYVKNSDGSGAEELLAETPGVDLATAWSPDGRQILFESVSAKSRNDLWLLPLHGERKPYPYLQTSFAEGGGVFSPDGKWIAFLSDQSGTEDVYIAPFLQGGSTIRVSTGGASYPRWSGVGRELFYFDVPRLRMLAIKVDSNQNRILVGEARPLFEHNFGGGSRFFDVSPDGRRFVTVRVAGPEKSDQLNLLIDWPALLKQ